GSVTPASVTQVWQPARAVRLSPTTVRSQWRCRVLFMFPISSVILKVPAPILILPWIIGRGAIESLLDLTKGSVIIWGLERRSRFGFQIFQGGLKCPLLRAPTWKKRWPTP